MGLSRNEMTAGSNNHAGFGNHHINPDCPLSAYNLSWGGNKPVIFRPFQAPDETMTSLQPCYQPSDSDFITDWVHMVPSLVRGTYSPNDDRNRISFMSDLASEDAANYTESPYDKFYKTVKALKQDPTWAYVANQLLEGSKGSGAALAKPGKVGFLQGTMYAHNGETFMSQPRHGVLLTLTNSALKKLVEVIFDERCDIFADPMLALHFSKADETGPVPPGCEIVAGRDQEFDPKATGYRVMVIRMPQGTPVATAESNIKEWVPWEQIPQYHTAAEQVKLLESVFDGALIKRVFTHTAFEHFLSDWVKQSADVVQAPPMQHSPHPQQGAPSFNGGGPPPQYQPPAQQHYTPQPPAQHQHYTPQPQQQPQQPQQQQAPLAPNPNPSPPAFHTPPQANLGAIPPAPGPAAPAAATPSPSAASVGENQQAINEILAKQQELNGGGGPSLGYTPNAQPSQ